MEKQEDFHEQLGLFQKKRIMNRRTNFTNSIL